MIFIVMKFMGFFNKKQQITLLAPSFSTLEIYGVVYSLGLNYFRELA